MQCDSEYRYRGQISVTTSTFNDTILRLPSPEPNVRWFLIGSGVAMCVFTVAFFPLDPPLNYFLLVFFSVFIILAGLFPERELNMSRRTATLDLKLFNVLTVFRWVRQITDEHTVQIHAEGFGQSRDNQRYRHRIAAVRNRQRIIIREYIKNDATPDLEVEEFAENVANALQIPCLGYAKPGFFWF